MKVYAIDGDSKILVGRADIDDDGSPIFRVHLFGAASTIVDDFMIGTVTHLRNGDEPPHVERVVLLGLGQRPEFLPGWQPLAS